MSRTMITLFVVLLTLGFLAHNTCALDVLSPPSLAGHYPSPGFPLYGAQGFSINTTIVFVEKGGCIDYSATVAANIAGKAAYVGGGFQGCSFQEVTRRMQNMGAIAVVFSAINGIANQDFPMLDGKDDKDLTIAVVEIDFEPDAKWKEVLNSGAVVSAIIYADPNPWYKPDGPYGTPAFVAEGAIIGCLCFFNLAMAVLKLVFYTRDKGFILSIISCILVLHIISNTLRIAFLWGDPQGTHYYFNWTAHRLLTSLHEPFQIIGECLILLCWYDLLSATSAKKVAFLAGRIPKILFGVFGLVLLAIEFGTAIPHGRFEAGIDSSRAASIIYAITHLACAIAYFILGKKLYDVLKGSNSLHIKVVARNTIVSAAFLILLIIAFILMATPFFWTPWGFYVCWVWMFLAISLSSSFQLASLQPPKWPGLLHLLFPTIFAKAEVSASTQQSSQSGVSSSTQKSSGGDSSMETKSASVGNV